MSFDDQYELEELLRDDGIRTFVAHEKQSGEKCLAHFFTNPAESAALAASVDRLAERERQRIASRGEHGGLSYVVTGALTGYAGIREWLAANAPERKPLDAVGAWKVILPERSIDEQFLNLFEGGEGTQSKLPAGLGGVPADAPPPRAEPQYPAKDQPPRDQQAKDQQAKDQPGEFTRLFQAPPVRVSPTSPAPFPKPPVETKQPGEFTQLFQTPPVRVSPTAPAPLPKPPVETKQPGEFTQLFQASPQRAPQPAAPISQPLSPFTQPASPFTQPSPKPMPEPTQIREQPQAREPAQASKKPDGPGEFTQFFQSQAPEQINAARNPLPAVPQPLPPSQMGPKEGEFTRVFGPGQVPGRGPAGPEATVRRPPEPPSKAPQLLRETPPLPVRGTLPLPVREPAPQPVREPFPEPRAPLPQATRAFDSVKPAAPPVPPGPGEFTVRFSAVPALTLGQSPASQAAAGQAPETPAPPQPSNKGISSGAALNSRWPLILGIAAVVVLLVAVVMFIASRAK